MYLSQEGLDEAVATMSARSYRNLGLADYVHDDQTRVARKRWGQLVRPNTYGWALALFYRPGADESTQGCCGGYEIPVLMEEMLNDWLDNMVLLPVKWTSLTDPLTLGLREQFASAYWGQAQDPDVVQATIRFPHVDVELGAFTSPLGGAADLSLTDYGSMYVWHLTPVSEEEAAMWVNAYNTAESTTEFLPTLAYNWCCTEDPVQELTTPEDYETWQGDPNSATACCSGSDDDEVIFIGGDEHMPLCVCCGYWDLRVWLYEHKFPSMQEYTGLVRNALGPSFYDDRWNEAVSWFRTGLDVAHDMAHLIASEGADEWCSWWESRYLPEACFGGRNALPLAQERFALLASSA